MKKSKCKTCYGKGSIQYDGDLLECPFCKGTGLDYEERVTFAGVARKEKKITIKLKGNNMNEDKIEFKVGDVVILNSGGPKMTVIDVGGNENSRGIYSYQIECKWFADSYVLCKDTFTKDCVRRVE